MLNNILLNKINYYNSFEICISRKLYRNNLFLSLFLNSNFIKLKSELL